MDLFFSPLPQYFLLATGLSLCVYLFGTLKKEIWSLGSRNKKQHRYFDEVIESLGTNLETVRSTLKEVKEQKGAAMPATPPKAGMNLSKRTQALRLMRRGEGPEHIAAALSLPHREVELLLKIQRVLTSGVDNFTA